MVCWLYARTVRSLSGILSRSASPLSSLPPEDEVPLPLGFDCLTVPLVGASAFGLAELAAGSPVGLRAPWRAAALGQR